MEQLKVTPALEKAYRQQSEYDRAQEFRNFLANLLGFLKDVGVPPRLLCRTVDKYAK